MFLRRKEKLFSIQHRAQNRGDGSEPDAPIIAIRAVWIHDFDHQLLARNDMGVLVAWRGMHFADCKHLRKEKR